MGRQWIEGFKEVETDLTTLLTIHLTGNHFPPVSTDFIPSCKEAIDACNIENYDKQITMPNGITRSASFIVEGLHLDTFLSE